MPGSVAVVVGAGPGGLQAALEFDSLGYRTHLFEARNEVGGGLAVSAAPPFKEPLRWYQSHLQHRLQASDVRLHLGRAAVAADVLALRPDAVVLATGSRARAFPLERADAALPVWDATDVLAGDRMPEAGRPVVVYGGGETGCETAEYLAQRGWQVVLVTRSGPKELARSAEPMYRRELRARLARNPLVELVAHASVSAVAADAVLLTLPGGPSRRVAAAALVMAQGRVPAAELVSALRAAGVRCVAIGDADGIGRIGDAVHAADRAVRQLAGQGQQADAGASATSH
jgi:pyruvate/2-oxoglutarate dehydrogenase complex dihydrolipoamide dehydrogenase (E3) component